MTLAKLTERRSAIERVMFDPSSAEGPDAKLSMTDLMKLRAEVSEKIEGAEAVWLEASEAIG